MSLSGPGIDVTYGMNADWLRAKNDTDLQKEGKGILLDLTDCPSMYFCSSKIAQKNHPKSIQIPKLEG